MRIADVFEIKFPVFVSLIGQTLRLAGNGIYFPTCGTNRIDDSFFYIAP
jgi:hypothetical protein